MIRRSRVPAALKAALGRERPLAWARLEDGWLAGTRSQLVHVPVSGEPTGVAWSSVQAADWSQDDSVLTVIEVGHPEARCTFRLGEADLLLQLVRERVQASIVLQRHHPVTGKAGIRVIGRRAPGGAIAWSVEYDEGVDPDAPCTRRTVESALTEARQDVGAEPI